MKLTKHGHACIRLEKGSRVMVIDPGTFTDVPAAMAGAEAVLVTHEHADHIDPAAVLPILGRTAGVHLYAPQAVVDQLLAHEAIGGSAARIHVVSPGDERHIAGFDVRAIGGQHALIHPQIPLVANLGYIIDGVLYHPGDSLIVPDGTGVDTVLVPLHAPWSKLQETVDFVVSVRAKHAYQIHDGLLNETGLGMMSGHVTRFGARYGTEFEYLQVGDSREI